MSVAHTAVHDNGQPSCFRYASGFLRDDPHLEPEHLCSDRNGLPCDLGSFLGGAEHLHYVHRHINLSERAEHGFSEELAITWVHRQDTILIGWPKCLIRKLWMCPQEARQQPGG